MNEELCKKCPVDIKGYCCFLNVRLGDYNIILENQPCPHLDLKTKECTVYDRRKELAPHCLDAEKTIGMGGLPKGCLYLKGHEKEEPHPKVFIKSIVHKLAKEHIGFFNLVNNIPFEKFVAYPEEVKELS